MSSQEPNNENASQGIRPEDGNLPSEAFGEDVLYRSQPADDPILPVDSRDLYHRMRGTIDRMEKDGMARGDLKILSRTLRELRYAFSVFRPFRRRRKVTVFGSARTKPDHPEYLSGVEVGRQFAEHGWMVITGAGGGIMEAGHRGAGTEASMGLNIMLPFEQSANEYIEGDPKLVTMKYFFTRKLMFVKECSGVVCLPGGFGTLDEAFETITLMQTGKQVMIPMVLLDAPEGSYWHDLEGFFKKHLLGGGMVSPADVNLYKVTRSIDETMEEILGFYRVYHSMRYIDDTLVFRLKEQISEEKLEGIQDEFADILVKGKFTLTNALDAEANETELSHMPRLAFQFNRRSLGRLRALINTINGK